MLFEFLELLFLEFKVVRMLVWSLMAFEVDAVNMFDVFDPRAMELSPP